jgi:hypothetical protein
LIDRALFRKFKKISRLKKFNFRKAKNQNKRGNPKIRGLQLERRRFAVFFLRFNRLILGQKQQNLSLGTANQDSV